MFNHEPDGYECPFCFLLGGGDTAVDDFYRETPEHRFAPLEERLPRVESLRRQLATAG